jgi:hypothetical protein
MKKFNYWQSKPFLRREHRFALVLWGAVIGRVGPILESIRSGKISTDNGV